MINDDRIVTNDGPAASTAVGAGGIVAKINLYPTSPTYPGMYLVTHKNDVDDTKVDFVNVVDRNGELLCTGQLPHRFAITVNSMIDYLWSARIEIGVCK